MERTSFYTQVHETIRHKVERIVKLVVLELHLDSKWADPTLIIPKKYGTISFIFNFQELNIAWFVSPSQAKNQ